MTNRDESPPPDRSDFPDVESTIGPTLVRFGVDNSDRNIVLASTSNPAADPRDEIGQERDRKYILEGELGRGGMGTVYRVRDQELHRSLAMKVVRGPDQPDAVDESHARALLARFLEEAQVTGQLDHPGIVPLHELGVDGEGRIYFTMRLVRGKHLGEVFDEIDAAEKTAAKETARKKGSRSRDAEWTLDRALIALLKVCEAMAYAHDKGVIHRDLKPANIMAGRFGEAYVMDWGLAKVRGRPDRMSPDASDPTVSQSLIQTGRSSETSDSDLLTLDGTVFGTPSYMAPEQGRGEIEKIDERSDVYSIGAILYRLLSGQAPYVPKKARVAPHMVLRWLLEGPPKPIRELNPSASVELAAISRKAMSRDPAHRYPTMEALGDDLRRFLRGQPVDAIRLGSFTRVKRWCLRNPVILGLLVASTVGGSVGLSQLSMLSRALVRASAIDDATAKAAILEEVNSLYSSDVVGKVDREHVEVTHDYATKAGAIPLPATFLTSLGEKISGLSSGVKVRHYSDYPFKFRADGGVHDDFERSAMARLREVPSEPFYEFSTLDSQPVLRFATARVLKESCVSCHNEHPDSIKRDWKVGDVRGVLEIIRPLRDDITRTDKGLRGALLVVGAIVVGLVMLSILVLLRQDRTRSK